MQVKLVNIGWLGSPMRVHVPLEVCSQVSISQHAIRQVFHAFRAQIDQSILRLIVMQKFPRWATGFVCFVDIHIVGIHVGRKHCLLVKLNHHVRWILLSICGHASSDVCQHNRGAWVRVGLDHFIVASVSVSVHGESDNVLESLHKGSIPGTELMLALLGGVMRDQEGKTTFSFSVEQLLFQPGKLMARVLSLPRCTS